MKGILSRKLFCCHNRHNWYWVFR